MITVQPKNKAEDCPESHVVAAGSEKSCTKDVHPRQFLSWAAGINDLTGYVYFARTDFHGENIIKIGHSKDPLDRMRWIDIELKARHGVMNPRTELICAVHGGMRAEAYLLGLFSRYLIGGEWFSDPNSTCRKHGSRSNARKAASAMIAEIPLPLAEFIGRSFWPAEARAVA